MRILLIWFWTGHFIDDILNELSKTSKNHGFKSKKRAFVAESFLFALLYEISFCTASVKWILINTVMPFVGIIWIWTFARIIESALKEEHHKKLLRFLYNGIIIKHQKTEPTYTKTSLFLCEKRRFFMARREKGVVPIIYFEKERGKSF